MKNSKLKISGMSCSGCAKSVERALINLDGVNQVSVDLSSGTAQVEFDEQQTGTVQFSRAIDEAGYKMDEKDNFLDDIR